MADVTASQAAALYGCGFDTELALWHSKRTGVPIEIGDTERMARGRWLEGGAAAMAEEKIGDRFVIEKANAYYRARSDVDQDMRLGATPDYLMRERGFTGASEPIPLECKTTDERGYYEHWESGIPLFYAIQGLVQMICMDAPEVYFAVLVFTSRGCQGHVRRLEYDERAARGLCSRVIRFWRRVRSGERPQVSYGADAATLDRLTLSPSHKRLGDKEAAWAEIDRLASAIVERREASKAIEDQDNKDRDRIRELLQDHTACQTSAANLSYKVRKKTSKRVLVINRRSEDKK